MSGAESRNLGTGSTALGVEGAYLSGAGVLTYDETIFRSGNLSFRFNSGAGSSVATIIFPFTGAHGTDYFARVLFYYTAHATGTAGVVLLKFGTASVSIRLKSDGTLILTNGAGTVIGNPTAVLNFSQWYRLELRVRTSAAASSTQAEARLDGVEFASSSTINETVTTSQLEIGNSGNATANWVCYLDDLSLNDSGGTEEKSWCGDGKVVLLLPIRDNSAGSWRAGSAASAAANGRLYNGIDNVPPIGAATPMAVTAGISNTISGATAPDGDFDIEPYDIYSATVGWNGTGATSNMGNGAALSRLAVPLIPSANQFLLGLAIRIRTSGAPADNLEIAIQDTDFFGLPSNSDLAVSSSIAASSLVAALRVEFFTFSSFALSAGVTYWAVLRRSGGDDITNFYVVAGQSNGAYWNGGTWTAGPAHQMAAQFSRAATVRVVQQVIVHGEDVTTGAKTGTFAMVSNPAITAANVLGPSLSNFGPDAGGAVGTYPTNWVVQRGAMTYRPVIAQSTKPVGRISKSDTGTRAADLCFMGLMVEYFPGTTQQRPWHLTQMGSVLAQ